jgi:thioesterase domain-containing protein
VMDAGGIEDQGSTPLVWLDQTARGADKTPLFLIHPLSGDVICYRPLARKLRYPTVGLQQDDQLSEKTLTIELLADRYAQCIEETHPSGEVMIGGWSLGGLVALEVARQLISKRPVRLVLIDSPPPGVSKQEQSHRSILRSYITELFERLEIDVSEALLELERAKDTELFESVLTIVNQYDIVKEASMTYLKTLVQQSSNNWSAYQKYSYPPVKLNVTVIVPIEANRSAKPVADQWSNIHGAVNVVQVPGNHMNMFYGKNLDSFVVTLRAAFGLA